jgi:hypothetical protein
MTPHPRCRRWFHAIRKTCLDCEVRRTLDECSESELSHKEWFSKNFPESYKLFNQHGLRLVKGGGK